MNRFSAIPAWASAALLVASAATFLIAVANPEQRSAWQVLLLLVQALMLSSFVAALIAARGVWRASKWRASAHVLVSLIATWCLYVAQIAIETGMNGDGHPVGMVITAIIGVLFIPVSGIAAALAASTGEAARFSPRTRVFGVSAGVVSVFGLITVIPFSQFTGTGYAVASLSVIGLALIGWWLGIGVAAMQSQPPSIAAAPSHTPPSP